MCHPLKHILFIYIFTQNATNKDFCAYRLHAAVLVFHSFSPENASFINNPTNKKIRV